MKSPPARIVAHLIVSSAFDSAAIQRECRQIAQWCQALGSTLVGLHISNENPKRYPYDYPAAMCMLASEADALLVWRGCGYGARPSNDLLEQICLNDEPIALMTPDDMQRRELWILPGPWDQQIPAVALDLSGSIRVN